MWTRSDQVIARFKSDVRAFLTLPGEELSLQGKPAVVFVVGVNGTGKTTTIGKLAALLRKQRKRVMVVAADTFRAAAAEQLGIWAERSGAEFVRGREGSDPSSVVYDGLAAAKARNADVVLIDTAGRLQTKTNLMEELKKMRRVVERETGSPPAETLLVVDGTTGQNAISQARLFNEATQLTGVVVTKLDSTAKGGVLVAVVDTVTVPIKFVGLGETIDSLEPFDPKAFLRRALRAGLRGLRARVLLLRPFLWRVLKAAHPAGGLALRFTSGTFGAGNSAARPRGASHAGPQTEQEFDCFLPDRVVNVRSGRDGRRGRRRGARQLAPGPAMISPWASPIGGRFE